MEVFRTSDIEILVATMNRASLDFLAAMFPAGAYQNFNIIVVNQTTPDALPESQHESVKVINSFQKGLSASRNLALAHARGKLCIIADDDIVFKSGFDAAIVNAFNDNPDAALISFRTEKTPGNLYKKYPVARKTLVSYLDLFNIMSVEMVLNRERIQHAGLKFDERFGLGAPFAMGEEAILINHLFRKKMKIVMEPVVINSHSAESSHAKVPFREKYYILGAVYSAVFGGKYYLWLLLKLLFDIKQHIIRPTQTADAIKAGIKGRTAFKNSL